MMEIVSIYITIIIGFSFNLYFFHKITSKKLILKLKAFFLIMISSVLLTFFNLTNQSMLLMFGNLICTGILINVFYNTEIAETAYYSTVLWIMTIFTDALGAFVIVNIGFNFYTISNKYLIRCLLLIPIILLEFLIFSVGKIRKFINNLYDKFLRKFKNKTFLGVCVFLIIYIFQILIYLTLYKSNSKIAYYTVVAILLIVLIVLIILIKYIIKSYELSIIINSVSRENELLKKISQKDELFRHNLINNLIGIESVANKKTKLLIDELILSYQSGCQNISHINKLPSGIDGIIYKKIYLKNIPDLNFVVENGFKEDILKIMTLKNYNLLAETIGILLDNALEAVEKCDEKIITIDIRKIDDSIYFEIKNTFNSIIDFDYLGTKKYTTKKEGHGIGINYLLKNKNVSTKASIINNMFIVQANIKLKK